MDYKSIIEKARARGVTSEKAMFANIESVSELLKEIKHAHPNKYWEFMRNTHEDLYGCHYDEDFAEYDVSQMHSTTKEGKVCHGQHWSKEEILSATQGKIFPVGTTDCDKYVAYNAMWHDLNKKFDDAEVLDAAYLFYFTDEDAPKGKIWAYMRAMRNCE